TGFCRLIDGTLIQVAGTHRVSGDPIRTEMNITDHPVSFDAEGIAAVRLDPEGNVQALAAGGLKKFKAGNLEILLDDRVDLALWIDQYGKWQGVLQDWDGVIPDPLLKITKDWSRLAIPVPYTGKNPD
ncbi:MAG: hypothetical protein IH594_18530, partial [Bacteroidales bacterium]|nr:hypothetical protein [Bacteroidales bacterium]